MFTRENPHRTNMLRWGAFILALPIAAFFAGAALNSSIKGLTGASYVVTTANEDEYYYCRKRPTLSDEGCYIIEPLTGRNIQICGPITIEEL